MDLKTARAKFHSQKNAAKKRGIGWELTFKQWLEWWGADLDNRGQRAWNLQMQRFGDVGPYAMDNIRKGHPKQNSQTYSVALQNRRAEAAKAAHEASLDAAETCDAEIDPEDEPISSYMSRDPSDTLQRGSRWDNLHKQNR
jgi:hypothetical protein